MSAPGDSPTRTLSAGRGTMPALLAVTVIALILRLTGVGFMLPHVAQVDEQVLFRQLWAERGVEPPGPKQSIPFAYPTLLGRTLDVLVPAGEPCEARTLEDHRACAVRDLVRIRAWLALAAGLGIPLLFFLARRFMPDPAALLAAALLAFSVLHGWYSSQARPHAPLCTLAIAAMIACVELRRRGDARAYILAGLTTAVAAGALQSGLFVVPALVIAHLLRRRSAARHAWAWFGGACALTAASVAFFYRHGANEPETGAPSGGEGVLGVFLDKMHGIGLDHFHGRGFAAMGRALLDYDPWLTLLAAAGLSLLVVRALRGGFSGGHVRDAAVLGAHAVTHVLAFGLFDRTFQRFLVPVVPYLCMLAAYAVITTALFAARLGRERAIRLAIQAVIVALAVAPAAFVAFKLARLRAAPDTLTRAADWFSANADREHDRIAIAPTLALPLLRRAEFVPDFKGVDHIAFSLWPDYQADLRPEARAGLDWALFAVPIQGRKSRERMEQDPDAFVRALDARYVVVDVNHDDRRPLLDVLRDAVIRHGRLVAHFGPREPTLPGDVPILYHLDGPMGPDADFAWRAARYSSQGPDLEIYELVR